MADGFLSDLLKRYSEGDEEDKKILIDIKRKLDSVDVSPKKRRKTEQDVSPATESTTTGDAGSDETHTEIRL